MRNALLKLYNTTLSYSKTKYATAVLSIVSFTEASFFIVPPDALIIAMGLSNRNKVFLYAFIAATFSVLGGVLGYCIGYFFYDYIGKPIINYLHYQSQLDTFKYFFNKYDMLAVIIGGFTPIPYKLVTLFAGFSKINFFIFVLASVLSRFARLLLVATLVYFCGNKANLIIEKHIGKITLISVILIALIFYFIFAKR